MKYQKDKNVKKYIAGGMFLVPAAIGAGQAIYGGIQANQAKKMAAGLRTPSVSSPQEYAQMMKAAYDAELMNRQLDEINRSMATSVDALQQAGGRALIGGLPGVQRAANQSAFEASQFENQQRLAALGEVAGAEERQMGREMDVYNQKLGMAQAALNAGVQTAAAGIGQIGSAAMYGADAFSQYEDPGATISAPQTEKTSIATPSSGLTDGLMSNRINIQRQIPAVSQAEYEAMLRKKSRFGNKFQMKNGGMVTGGKFSHETNPIDIVQKGKKVGEMTGGEVILNPSQAAKLSKESTYFRKLLNKFNKSK
jgi:hypothetical protein